jgi:DNA replication protein DnaC
MNDLGYALRRVVRQVHDVAQQTNSKTSSKEEKKKVCPICKGAGFVRRDLPPNDPMFGRALVCKCTKTKIDEQRQQRLIKLSNLGMLTRFTFETFVFDHQKFSTKRKISLENAYRTCRGYAEEPEGWLILMGTYGAGKTHLGAAIANYRIAQGKFTLFIVVPDLLDHLRAAYGPRSQVAYDERFNQVRNVPLLILDNLGSQASTPWAEEKLFQLLNHRYNAGLPTVITTNQRLEELDPRIRSRLADPRLAKLLTIEGPDWQAYQIQETSQNLSTLSLLKHMTFERFDRRLHNLLPAQHESLEHAYNASYDFSQKPSGWLLLIGDFGIGKTHLAAAIANTQQSEGQEALFIVVPDLLDHLRSTYNPQSTASYDERFEQIRRSPLLVLDDLGSQSATRWAQEKLFQLFNYRYMAQLPTVITLNSLNNIEPRLRERILEMVEIGQGAFVEMSLPPYRSRFAYRGKERKQRLGQSL